jgi:hypothetical protein
MGGTPLVAGGKGRSQPLDPHHSPKIQRLNPNKLEPEPSRPPETQRPTPAPASVSHPPRSRARRRVHESSEPVSRPRARQRVQRSSEPAPRPRARHKVCSSSEPAYVAPLGEVESSPVVRASLCHTLGRGGESIIHLSSRRVLGRDENPHYLIPISLFFSLPWCLHSKRCALDTLCPSQRGRAA